MSVVARREREKLIRREIILEAAEGLFEIKGFETTTVDEIASSAELGKGTIYSYFRSKEEIYIAILEKGLNVLMEKCRQAIGGSNSATEALNNLYLTFVKYHQEHQGFIETLILQADEQRALKLGDLIINLRGKATDWVDLVSEVLKWGIQKGEFAELEVNKVANVIIGMIVGLIIQSKIGQISEELGSYRDTMFQMLLEGIKVKDCI